MSSLGVRRNTMYVALVDLDVFSGFSVFYPLASSSAPVYPLPPPTTLAGALAYPYLRLQSREDEKGYSAAFKVLEHLVYATAGSEGYVVSRDVERIYQAIYQRKKYWEEEYRAQWFTVSVRGVTRYVNDTLHVLYISRSRDILQYAYGITRLGRKECHVAVRSVIIKPLSEVTIEARENNRFNTIFYLPTRIAVCEGASRIKMPKLAPVNYTYTLEPEMEEYYVPKGLGPIACDLEPEGVLISINGHNIAIPRDAIV